MLNLFKLFGTIAVNNSDANDSIDDTTDRAQGAASSIQSAFKKIGTAVITYFAADKIKDFGLEVAETSATVAAEQSAFEQIMGDYAKSAEQKLKSVADNVGMMDSRLTPYMTSITAKFKGLGYDVDDATTLAQRGLTLAADAAAFWDKSLDDAMGGLNSFINGSYEGGEAIGLFANDTQLAAYAVSQGLISETKEWSTLEEAIKQATRLQYAEDMYALSGATGQAAKESDQYANVQANLTEKWRQFKAQIGEPILQNIVVPGMALLSSAADTASSKFEQISPYIDRFVGFVGNARDAAVALGDYAQSTFSPVIERAGDMFQSAREKLQPLIDAFGNYVGSGGLAEDATNALEGAIRITADAANFLLDGVDGVAQGFQDMYTWGQQNQTTLTVLATIFGGLTTAVLAYNAAKIAKRAIDVAETAYIYGLIAAETAHTAVTTVATAATTAFGAAVAFLTSPVTLVILAITALIAIGVALYQNWDTVKAKCAELGQAIAGKFEEMKNAVSNKVESMKQAVTNKVESMKQAASNKIESLRQAATNKIESLRQAAGSKFEAMKNTMGNLMQAARDNVDAKLQAMKASYESHGGGMKGIVFATMTGIKEVYSTYYDIINTLTGGSLDKVVGFFRDKMESAKNVVKSAIDKIRSFFDFEWSLPKLKLPHISISGKFSLNPPSAPHFSIEWYKKAMENAMVLNGPTIFGYNPSTGKAMGGGEAGKEVVSGADTLKEMIRDAVRSESDSKDVIPILETLLSWLISGGLETLLVDILTKNLKIKWEDRELARLVKTYA